MRFPVTKRPVKDEDLLTEEEMKEIAKMKQWPLEKAALWMCGVRKPWADNEFPPYGPPGKPTYKQVQQRVMAAAKKGEFDVIKR